MYYFILLLANGSLVLEMKDMMSIVIRENFERFQLGFAAKIGDEVRSQQAKYVNCLK